MSSFSPFPCIRVVNPTFGLAYQFVLIHSSSHLTPFFSHLCIFSHPHPSRIPDWLVRRMLVNNAVSAGLGFVPFIGDVFIAIYKANSRNAYLLEEFLRIRGEEFLKADRNKLENPEHVKPGAGAAKGEIMDGKKKK